MPTARVVGTAALALAIPMLAPAALADTPARSGVAGAGGAHPIGVEIPKGLHIPPAKLPRITRKNRTPGVPTGGPKVLYAPPPKLPMISNHNRHFRAPYELAEGTERYIGGEYQYTGYAYDDAESAYPQDFKRYGNNSANLIEFRVAPYDGGVAYRFTFNTLMHKDTTIATVAFNTDRKTSTGSAKLPKDPGLPFPGTDQALTTWGTGATWSYWTGHRWRNTPLRLTTSLRANQMTIDVPDTVSRPSGNWAGTLATGVYDPATKGWLPIARNSDSTSNIVDLGFRFNESRSTAGGLLASNTPWTNQSAALKAGRPTIFAHTLHWGWMRRRIAWDNIPRHGLFLRMAPSYLNGATANDAGQPLGITAVDSLGGLGTTPDFVFRREGWDPKSWAARYFSPLQPYAIYVPPHYRPGTPERLSFWLHPDEGTYYGLGVGAAMLLKVLGSDRNSIIIDPASRSDTGFFIGDMEEGIFEAWNDVARHYTLDPTRTVMAGGSGGGYGAYRTGTMWPELFASDLAFVPAAQHGLYFPGLSDEDTVLNNWLPNLRNLPVYHMSDMASELTFYPGQVQNVLGPSLLGNSLDQLGYRFVFQSVAIDHLLASADIPAAWLWLGDRQVDSDPFHVTYVRQPATDDVPDAIVHNKAYWLSHIKIRNNSTPYAKGTIDVLSEGFGRRDAPYHLSIPSIGLDEGNQVYWEVKGVWGPTRKAPKRDRLRIKATNIRSIAIDPKAARVSCNARLRIHSDGPIKVTLRGCPNEGTSNERG